MYDDLIRAGAITLPKPIIPRALLLFDAPPDEPQSLTYAMDEGGSNGRIASMIDSMVMGMMLRASRPIMSSQEINTRVAKQRDDMRHDRDRATSDEISCEYIGHDDSLAILLQKMTQNPAS